MIEISVVMPIYNSEKTLENTIDSLVKQNFDKRYEIILINDGSTDSSELICKKYMKLYNNIIYKKIANGGVSNARNIGLSLATGKYLMFIDSDDTFELDTLKNMYDSISTENVDLVIAGYNRINETSNRIIKISPDEKIYCKREFDEVICTGQNKNLFNQLWNKIYRLDVIKNNDLNFNTKLSLGEDFQFVMSYIKHIDKIKMSSEVIYNYINSTSGLNTKYRKNRLDINLENMRLLEEYFKKNCFDLSYINKKYFITILSGLNNICKNPNKCEKKEDLKKFVNNEFIYEKISTKISFKFTIIKLILKIKNIYLLLLLGKILNIYDSMYKKYKLGY